MRLLRIPSWLRHAVHHSFASQRFTLENLDDQYKAYWRKKTGGDFTRINPPQAKKAAWVGSVAERGDTVIDLGCGNGAVSRVLRERRRDLRIIAADLSPDCLEFLEQEGFEVLRHDANTPGAVESLPSCDWAMLFEVLEHLPDPERYLLDVWGKVRKGVFLSVPNTGYFPYRIRLLLGSFPIQWHVLPGEHLRFWTASDMKWWLEHLEFGGRFSISFIDGPPVLNRIWGSLFGMGLIVRLDKADARRSFSDNALPEGRGS